MNCVNGSWVFGVTGAIEGLMGISKLTGSIESDNNTAITLKMSRKSRLAHLKAAS